MNIDLTTLSFALALLALIVSLYAFSQAGKEKSSSKEKFNSIPLRLQAYERLVLLAERISLPQLISRLNQPGLNATEMKLLLVEQIKSEFEYNSTQQLYVSQLAWDAIRNLKEQEIMLINQVYSTLPSSALAADLNRKILEVFMAQPEGALNEVVTQTLNHEAKKLMS
ncbi:MAG: hypothetical protein ACO3AY_06960 [Chitinophagaceae bacterium]